MSPGAYLHAGVAILYPYLGPLGFKFEFIGEGNGSGGQFAYGQFCKDDSITIELHFRYSLGLVTYHIDDLTVSHQEYLDLINKHGQNKYPGFPKEPLDSFYDLLWDLQHLLNDFTEKDGSLLRGKRSELIEKQSSNFDQEKKSYSGDQRRIDLARTEFKNGCYQKVDTLRRQLQHPELLTNSERKLFNVNSKKLADQI